VGAGEHGALRWLATAASAVLVSLPLTGCDLPACESLDLQSEHGRALEQVDGPASVPAVLAVSDGSTVSILRGCKNIGDCEDLSIDLQQAPEQLMLTASGRWLVHRTNTLVERRDLHACTTVADGHVCPNYSVGTKNNIAELVGTLRGGDWIIYHDKNRQLWAVHVGDGELREFPLGSGLGLSVIALGHRHVIAHKRRGDGIEELYLIRVAAAPEIDEFAENNTGKAKLLAVGPAFRRVLITEGPSPAELDLGDDEVPTDARVIATSGEGAGARTLIYDVSNLGQIANFAGEVVTKHAVLEDVPGLSGVSPDGSHLAYLTSDGGLALRNLETQRSCLVKSSDASKHLLAGFAADATLYFEAEEEAYLRADNTGYERQPVENIHAYDPLTETFTALTTSQTDSRAKVWRLKAAPPSHDGQPWAIAAYDGEHIVKPGSKAESLNYEEARFLPRSTGDLWVLEAKSERLDVHRLDPRLDEKIRTYTPESMVCVSSSHSADGTAPWATRCSDVSEPEKYLDNSLPDLEQGP
jgi:hypothetical protein